MTELCRICVNKNCNQHYIDITSKLNEEKTVMDCIIEFSSIKILDNDPLPQSICNQCYGQLHQFNIFRDLILTSDRNLKDKYSSNSTISTKNVLSFNEINDDRIDTTEIDFDDNSEETKLLEIDTCYTQVENLKTDLKNDLFNNINSPTSNNVNNDYCDTIETRGANVGKKRSDAKDRKTVRTLKRSKPKISRAQKIHECKECQKIFKKADHLNVHITYKHSEKQFKCEICEKKFARKYDLAYHRRVHTGERPFTCEMCGKSFASSSYFYIHKRTHTGLKKIKCEYCQNAFNNSDQLQIHIRQKHTGERPFLCEMCSQAFTSSSALFRHKRDVHDQKVECPICKKLYSSRVLKDHIKRHKDKEEGIKRFSCDLCGKRFTCATSRKRHLVVHSGEKAFKCEVCEKSFNQRSTLQTHMRIHSQIMPFHCEMCTKSFRYKHHLKIHWEKHHKQEDCGVSDIPNYKNILIKTECC